MIKTDDKQAWGLACFAEQPAEQSWLRDIQEQELTAFSALGFPTRKDERWKYTDVNFLKNKTYKKSSAMPAEKTIVELAQQRLPNTETIFIVLVNGHYATHLSDTQLLPAGVILCSMQEAIKNYPKLVKENLTKENVHRSSFASLNTALLTDGVFLQIPKNTVISTPIHFLYINAHQQDFVSSSRNIIIAEANSQATILEEHDAQDAKNYFSNSVTDIQAQQGSRIFYHKIQNEDLQSTHISQTFVNQAKDSLVKICALALGSGLARDDIFVNLNEAGAESSVNGFYVLSQDDQHIDNHIQIDHIAPHGVSDMMYKGVLDKKSHAVFNGKILVHPDAQKTRSQQANHNLLLSADAVISTKPELEIYADDVKCAHGDTVGQLDTEALFYLRSRGIDKHAALKLLTYAFASDVMNRISHPAIKQRMTLLLNEKLTDES